MRKTTAFLLFTFLVFTLSAQFDGPVGTPGCQAISQDDPAILGWATGCEVLRGYQDIATAVVTVSYGESEDAIGKPDSDGMTVVSLGDSGVAILTFDIPITNGEGYDFAVFENSFSHTFLELAFVEVSSNGERWVRFPATSNTQTETQIDGFGHIDATQINNLAGKYKIGWGTPFDLDELRDSADIDIDNITHVKIIDVIGTINPKYAQYDAYGNIVNDPYPTDFSSGGFDLAGVAILNGWQPATSIKENTANVIQVYPNPCHDFITINNLKPNQMLSFYTILGVKLWETIATDGQLRIEVGDFPDGVYLLKVGNNSCKIVKR
ncbi:T9SS type A sorting domain-containing protein [Bacteroidales bacterium OttesenSCG-928-B11]|nr:T9SS type A sorting domain-containing protein [Bacteroidales bacterium OttesenSCG-928-C03]MDL2312227.1 T9SS type A sorting domain-containing protein [Bacteroidales bacterium OttesenSCG-928-B11]